MESKRKNTEEKFKNISFFYWHLCDLLRHTTGDYQNEISALLLMYSKEEIDNMVLFQLNKKSPLKLNLRIKNIAHNFKSNMDEYSEFIQIQGLLKSK